MQDSPHKLNGGPDLKVITSDMLSEDYKLYPLATFTQRAFALLLDGFIFGIITTLLGKGIAFALGHSGPQVGIGPMLLQISFVFIYYYFPLYSSGETLGKKLVGIRVVSETGDGKLGFGQVLGRESIGKLISILPFGLGYVGANTRKDKKTWHDRIFGTRVVTFRR